MVDVYMTADGKSRDTTRAIAASRVRFGVESSKDWLDGYGPQFLDYPFTDPEATFADHRDAVAENYPTLTVAPDVEKGLTLSDAVAVGDDLLQYAREVILVPKDCRPSAVPDRFRVGLTAADFGSNAPWTVWDYQDCGPVHILGGPPGRQLEIGEYVPVASVDTATLGQRCRFGMWHNGSTDAPVSWDYRRRLKESLDNYWRAWN